MTHNLKLPHRLWVAYVHQVRGASARRATEIRIQRRAERRRQQLVEAHMGLVVKIARQLHRRMFFHLDREELEADGYLGLVEAAAAYQPAAGEFEHYAYFRIRGSIIDAHKRRAYRDETMVTLEQLDDQHDHAQSRYEPVDPSPAPDELLERKQLDQVAAAAIRRLPEDQRTILLEALAGTPIAETAAGRGRSVAWARAKLAQARNSVAAAVREVA